jgi:hypothetical protein
MSRAPIFLVKGVRYEKGNADFGLDVVSRGTSSAAGESGSERSTHKTGAGAT